MRQRPALKLASARRVGAVEAGHVFPDSTGVKKGMPPTYLRVNDYTKGCQELVTTDGVPGYQEASTALLTTITFLFIFGMMYGDVMKAKVR